MRYEMEMCKTKMKIRRIADVEMWRIEDELKMKTKIWRIEDVEIWRIEDSEIQTQ